MVLTTHFFLGFMVSFLGTVVPSMLNMNAVKISIHKSRNEAHKFATGVSLIVMLQAYIAIIFTQYIHNNPIVLEMLQNIAAVIFIFLSGYFYFQYKKEKAPKHNKEKSSKNSFVTGVFLSALNMFSIPFYCAVTNEFKMVGWLQFNQKTILLFIVGAALGTFVLLNLYAKFAQIIQDKSTLFTKKINLFLSFLTGSIAILTFVKFLI